MSLMFLKAVVFLCLHLTHHLNSCTLPLKQTNKQTNKQKHILLFSDFPPTTLAIYCVLLLYGLLPPLLSQDMWKHLGLNPDSWAFSFPSTLNTEMISSDHVAVNIAYRHMIPKWVSPPFPLPTSPDTDLSVFVFQECCDRLSGLSNKIFSQFCRLDIGNHNVSRLVPSEGSEEEKFHFSFPSSGSFRYFLAYKWHSPLSSHHLSSMCVCFCV